MWRDQCNWAQYSTSISNDNVIESLDQVGVLFLSDLSRQEGSKYTTTSQQEFDVPESRTDRGIYFSETTNARWRQVTRCVGHDVALLSIVRGDFQSASLALRRVRGGTKQKFRTAQKCAKDSDTASRCSECADSRDSDRERQT